MQWSRSQAPSCSGLVPRLCHAVVCLYTVLRIWEQESIDPLCLFVQQMFVRALLHSWPVYITVIYYPFKVYTCTIYMQLCHKPDYFTVVTHDANKVV